MNGAAKCYTRFPSGVVIRKAMGDDHSTPEPPYEIEEDDIPPEDMEEISPTRPCCLRVRVGGGWCIMPDGHPPPCRGVSAEFGPLRPPADRILMVEFTRDLQLKWHRDMAKRVEWLVKWNLS